ncbi:MAG TPA: sulfatase-like hydrolase/transferase [Thermoleophilaceae bacterium]|nr:sulfatase-like hydrolase/transferase [Thermoleophilaceae bacterium]
MLGRTPEFFVARGNTNGDILVFALAIVFLPPLALAALELVVVQLSPRVGAWLHLALVALLVTLIALPPLGDITGGSVLAAGLAVLAGVLVATVYARTSFARSFATVLAAAPVLFLLFFLTLSPVSKLLLASETSPDTGTPASNPVPVVMIVFDELPVTTLMDEHGGLDANRFPAFGRLAADATWYRNATTVAEQTTQAVPAILSGQIPAKGTLPVSADHPRNLFTMLADSHELEVIEPYTDLCPARLCEESRDPAASRLRELLSDLGVVSLHMLLPDDLKSGLPAIDQTWTGFGHTGGKSAAVDAFSAHALSNLGEEDELADFGRFMTGVRQPQGDRPRLHFLHISLPHAPWTSLPTGQQYVVKRGNLPGLDGAAWSGDPTLVNQGLERHMLQTGLADRLLGETLQRLRAAGLYDRAMIVVVADHGTSFIPGQPRRDATRANLADIAGVPLLVKRPGQVAGHKSDVGARTIDVLPTISKALHAGSGWRFDGVPLDERSMPSRPVAIYRSGEPAVSEPLGEFARERDARARHLAGLLRDAAGPAGLHVLGPRPDLLGRSLGDFAIEPPDGTGALEAPNAWARVDPEAALVPVEVAGEVQASHPGRTVAVAVNGTVAAATTTVEGGDGRATFSVLLPLSSLRRGRNEVVALEPRGGSKMRTLARSTTLPPYRLDAARKLLADPRGRRITVDYETAKGWVDFARIDGGVLRLSGWAIATGLGGPADRVVAVTGGTSVADTAPSAARPDVARTFDAGDTLLRSGFSMSVPVSLIDCSAPGKGLALLGVVERRATQIPQVKNVRDALGDVCRDRRSPDRDGSAAR